MKGNKERWRSVNACKGFYSNYYEVSNLGRIRSRTRKIQNSAGVYRTYKSKIIKPFKSGNGHLQVKLYKHQIKKQLYVHRLVAEAFIPNRNLLPFINHLDGDKTNNVHSNLKWCTQKSNVHHAIINGMHKFRSRPVINCRGKVFNTILEAASAAGLKSTSGIIAVCQGKRNYSGKYLDGSRIKWNYITADVKRKEVKHA